MNEREPDPLSEVEAAYRAYSADCYRFAFSIVRDRELARDVVQEVFTKLCRDISRHEPERGSLLTWLMTLTHNEAVDLVRWRHRHVRLDVTDESLTRRASDDLRTEASALLRLDRERLVAALEQLNPADRLVIVLAHFGGFSQHEIADRTGVPLGTVKSRTRGGLRRMRISLSTI